MNIPKQALDLVKQFEGCALSSYQDQRGIWTIGVGHTEGVHEGMEISEDEADQYLSQDLKVAANAVSRLTKVRLGDNQYSALIDFVYNLGSGIYQRSTLRMVLNRGMYNEVPAELVKYIYAGAIKSQGLLRRREAEMDLWNAKD